MRLPLHRSHYAAPYDPVVCPWCIADGTATAKSHGVLVDLAGAVPDDVPTEVIDELTHRTPGFVGRYEERWLFHCGDAAAFLGPSDPHDGPATYRFWCLHCGTHLTYSDPD